jgi:GNAT superfamily N-acetyltransferase
MEIVNTDSLTTEQKEQLVKLWNDQYPKALSLAGVQGFDEYLEKLLDKHHLLLLDHGKVLGWLIYFMRDGERCFAMLLDTLLQGKGMGSALLRNAMEYNAELVGWVIDTNEHLKNDGSFYKSPVEFYKKVGFETIQDVATVKNGIKGVRVRWQR